MPTIILILYQLFPAIIYGRDKIQVNHKVKNPGWLIGFKDIKPINQYDKWCEP